MFYSFCNWCWSFLSFYSNWSYLIFLEFISHSSIPEFSPNFFKISNVLFQCILQRIFTNAKKVSLFFFNFDLFLISVSESPLMYLCFSWNQICLHLFHFQFCFKDIMLASYFDACGVKLIVSNFEIYLVMHFFEIAKLMLFWNLIVLCIFHIFYLLI